MRAFSRFDLGLLQRQQIFSIAVGDLGCRLGPERRQVRKQMALRFPSPFHDVGRRRVPAAGEVESGWRRGAVVIRIWDEHDKLGTPHRPSGKP
ncbi:MAG: hypothetical protein WA645_17660 [Pseudolabrys sp.]|jgi:hypothetical protein